MYFSLPFAASYFLGLLTDIFRCVARNLTFADFMAVFYGRPDSLGRLRTPLRELIATQVLENQPLTDENVNRAVEKLLEDMRPYVESACVSAPFVKIILKVKTSVDFNTHHLWH